MLWRSFDSHHFCSSSFIDWTSRYPRCRRRVVVVVFSAFIIFLLRFRMVFKLSSLFTGSSPASTTTDGNVVGCSPHCGVVAAGAAAGGGASASASASTPTTDRTSAPPTTVSDLAASDPTTPPFDGPELRLGQNALDVEEQILAQQRQVQRQGIQLDDLVDEDSGAGIPGLSGSGEAELSQHLSKPILRDQKPMTKVLVDPDTDVDNPLLTLTADQDFTPIEYENRRSRWWRKARQLTRWKIRPPLNPQSIRFLVLSYGTRGDVQPYIALCLILMKNGHQCRIATHTDYKDWIESFGIEHAPLCGKGDLIKDFMASLTQNGITNLKNLKMVYLLGKFFHEAFRDGWEAAKDGNQDVILGVG